jgi:OFA family oxalate/formate antiporter-like MFS transporter
MRPDFPFRPTAFPFYYGWVVLAASTIGLVMSAPGQTIGVSVFTESLLDVTGLSRVEFSNAYLMGTLASGLMLPYAGTVIDRIGVRSGVVWASFGLGLVVAYLSQVDRLAARFSSFGISETVAAYALLTLGFLGLRFSGQGILTLVCRTMLGRWFERRRGLVSSISGPFASFAFAGSPLVLAGWVANSGWRGAWLEISLVVGIGMAAFGWIFFRENPEECGLEIDGGPDPALLTDAGGASERASVARQRDFTRGEAIRTAAFWIVTLGISNHAMVGTGMALHIVDLGAEVGLAKSDALGIFLPITLISVPTGIAIGLAVDRFPMRFLLMGMMVGQVLMFGLAPRLGDPLLYWFCIAGWGFSGGFYGPLSVAAIPNFFGRTHLGAISGVMMMVIVIASALGPAMLATVKSSFGSYGVGLQVLAFLPLVIFFIAPFTRDPQIE